MRMMNPDIVFCQNNGVLAVKPTRTGRLAWFVATTVGGHDRVWIFADATEYTDDNGNRRIAHHLRGATVGIYEQGKNFLARCAEIGLRAEHGDFFVPCSNGERRHGESVSGKPMADYRDEELAVTRWDLPNVETLRQFVR